MAIADIKQTVLLFVTDYINTGSAGKMIGPERLVGEVAREMGTEDGFLFYRPSDKNGYETWAGINLNDIHSFRVESIKCE
ncbi:TPA: hypothetical protein ACQ431_002997 [Citrobacter murliniae]